MKKKAKQKQNKNLAVRGETVRFLGSTANVVGGYCGGTGGGCAGCTYTCGETGCTNSAEISY
jgi:hypothetical protein